MGLRLLIILFQCGDILYTSESDVSRRQILTYKDGPRTERVNKDRHRIRNSSYGGLRPSTLPLGHGGSPQ